MIGTYYDAANSNVVCVMCKGMAVYVAWELDLEEV